MHLRKTNLGGQRPAPVPALGDRNWPAEETVLRVSLRLSDRKRDWIQRGTGNVSLPGLPGGGASHLRTRLRLENSLLTGKITERAWQPAQTRPEMMLHLNSLR